MRWLRAALLLAAVVLSAASSQPEYSVRRAALAPHAAPPMRSGQPMEQRAEVALGTTSAVSAGDPTPSEYSDPGVELPRFDLNGALRLKLGRGADLGFIWDQGFDDGARSLSGDQPEVTYGDVYGGGLSFMYSADAGVPGLHIATTIDVMSYSVPYVEYRTCVDNCDGVPQTEVYNGRTRVPAIGLGALGSYRTGPWTFFGGFSLRTHPTVDKGGTEYGAGNGESTEDVTGGEFNLILSAGTELAIGRNLRAMAIVYQPVEGDPVNYAPTVALGVTIPFGGAPAAPAPPAPEPATLAAR